jgi:hypothetical protein
MAATIAKLRAAAKCNWHILQRVLEKLHRKFAIRRLNWPPGFG